MPIVSGSAFDTAGLVTAAIQSLLNDQLGNLYVAGGSTVVISTISRASNVVTVTTATNNNFTSGQVINIAGVTDSTYNGSFACTVNSATQFTYAQAGTNSSSAGGTATGPVTAGQINVIPYMNIAYRRIQRAMANVGSASYTVDNLEFVIPAVAGIDPSLQIVVNDTSNPALPVDLLVPEKLWDPTITSQGSK